MPKSSLKKKKKGANKGASKLANAANAVAINSKKPEDVAKSYGVSLAELNTQVKKVLRRQATTVIVRPIMA